MSAEQPTTGQVRPDNSNNSFPHPLDPLSVTELDSVRRAILRSRGQDNAIHFRSIFLEEPLKKRLTSFLDLESVGKVTSQTPRPARVAKVQYDIIRNTKDHEYMESSVDVKTGSEVQHRTIDKMHQAALVL